MTELHEKRNTPCATDLEEHHRSMEENRNSLIRKLSDVEEQLKTTSPVVLLDKIAWLIIENVQVRQEGLAFTPHMKRTDLAPRKEIPPRRNKIYTRRDTCLDNGCEDDCPACTIEKFHRFLGSKIATLHLNVAPRVLRSTLENFRRLKGVNAERSVEDNRPRVEDLNRELSADIPKKSQRYERIAQRLGLSAGRIRYIIEGPRRSKKK